MEREARRKKKKSRETDRMALIMGGVEDADPKIAKYSSFSHNREDHLAKHSRSSSDLYRPTTTSDCFHTVSFLPQFHSQFLNSNALPDTVLRHDDDDDDEYVCKQNATKISREEGAASSSAPFSHRRATSALVASRPSHDAELPRKPFKYHLNSITPRDINFSIISSENTRVVCSFVITVLVVLSQINLPHKVIKSKSLIDYRPLYAVLLSDLLIVSATLAICSQGEEDEKEMKLEGDVNWEGAVKLLEWGLILHQTIRAIFIDCRLLYVAFLSCTDSCIF